MELIKNFIQEEDGVTAIEYGLIAALIAVVIVTAVTGAGTSLKGMFEFVCEKLVAATPTGKTAGTCTTAG